MAEDEDFVPWYKTYTREELAKQILKTEAERDQLRAALLDAPEPVSLSEPWEPRAYQRWYRVTVEPLKDAD